MINIRACGQPSTTMGPAVARRGAALLLALALVGVTFVATSSPTGAQATHVVVAVAKYVGLTAAFAEALQKLAGAVSESYGAGRTITDDLACRRQQAALRELVITMRDLEVEKRELHRRLELALFQMGHWLDWRRVAAQATSIRASILEVEQQVREHGPVFAGNAAVSRAYTNLLLSFDAKQDLLSNLAAEMQAIDWTWARVDRRDARRSAPELRLLAQDLQVQIEVIAEATDVIADYADGLCEPPLG